MLFSMHGAGLAPGRPLILTRFFVVLLLAGAVWLAPAGADAAGPPALQVNDQGTETAEEVTIAVNPGNPDQVVAGANIHFVFRSSDGGSNWTQDQLISPYGVAGDPVVIFDNVGNLFYAHLSLPQYGSWLDRIVIQKSTDGGLTWDGGVGVGLNEPKNQDKPWLAVDRTNSPYSNNLYLAWTEFDTYGSFDTADSTRILFAFSDQEGLIWSPPVRVDDVGGNCLDSDETVEGAVPAVGPLGQVYVAWAGNGMIWFDKSLDGGRTFGSDVLVTAQPGGWDFAISGISRGNGLPITACDASFSPYRGRIYIVFSDQRNGIDDTDVFLCCSDDEGVTWSPPSRVNDDQASAHQFFPWLSVDPVNGTLAVVFYDRRHGAGDATEVFVARSTDGGQTFTNFPVSDTPFIPLDRVFFGDYIGVAAQAGKIYPIWTRMDAGVLSIWSAVVDFPTGVARGGRPRVQTARLGQIPLNSSDEHMDIAYTLYEDSPLELAVYDLRGARIKVLDDGYRQQGEHHVYWDGSTAKGSKVAAGLYILGLKTAGNMVTRKVTVVR